MHRFFRFLLGTRPESTLYNKHLSEYAEDISRFLETLGEEGINPTPFELTEKDISKTLVRVRGKEKKWDRYLTFRQFHKEFHKVHHPEKEFLEDI